MRSARWLAIAALVAGAVAAAAWGVARASRPADPAARVAEARAALGKALAEERAAGAAVTGHAAEAVRAGGEPAELFARLAALDRKNWSVAFVREGRVEAWAGAPPAGLEGWALDGPKGMWESSAWVYLWSQLEAAGGRVVFTRTLRPRVPLPRELLRPAFPAEEIAARSGVTLSWIGDGEKSNLGEGIAPVLEAPGAAQLRTEARRGANLVARTAAGTALLLLVLAAAIFFLRSEAHPALRHAVLAVAIWGARALALALDIPAAIFEGPVFDNGQFGTLRFFQLAGTAGDLAITSAAGAIHIALLTARGLPGLPKWLGGLLPVAFAGVAWIYREHLTSVVRDSRVDLLNATNALPAGAAAALWFSVAAGSIACFLAARLAARAAGEALESWTGPANAGWARVAAVALTAGAGLAGFRSPAALAFLPWLALLLPRRPAVPLVAVGGALAAAFLSGSALAREADSQARTDLVQLADKVTHREDAGFRGFARDAALRLGRLRADRPPTEKEMLDVWAACDAPRNGHPALGIAWFDGRDWRTFAVGLPGWTPGEVEGDTGPRPRASGGTLLFDYTAVVTPAGHPGRVLATVRAPAGEGSAPLLRAAALTPPGLLAVFDQQHGWTDSRLGAAPPPISPGEQRWQNLDLAGQPHEVLFRATGDDGDPRRIWAFGRRRATLEESIVRALRTIFLFTLCGAAFGLVLVFAARAAGTLPPDLYGRLEVRLTLALLAVSTVPVAGLGFLAQSLATRPLGQALEKREEEATTIAMKRALESSGGQYSAVSDGILTGVEDLVGRDVYYYYNGKLKAVGQPALRTLEVPPGYVPAGAYLEVALQGGRFRHGRPGTGVAPAGTTWTAGELSRKAMVGVTAGPEGGAGEAGRASSLALGGATLVALLLWPLSALIARRISGPVAALTAAAGRIEAGDLAVRVDAPAEGDVAELVAAFNRMTEGLARGRDALARAERERAWREMARQVAHEIKNPLTPLKLALQNLRAAWQAKDPDFGTQLNESVDLTIGQIDLLARIATNFSQFAGKPSRAVEALDLNAILRGVVELFRPTAPGVTFVQDLEEALLPVQGDRDEVARAFTNLVKNAVQAMPSGGMLTATTRNEGAEVEVRIRDTGVGISTEVQARMFEPYFSTKTEGTGLGLGISRRVIEDMGGKITFTSEAGKGTTMVVRVPGRA
ncbi:MAG: HAMP domain-containing protein [Planctomycetes bacterium]|nr:HAMP domain-containing protein [Planctomycetota bacterium]